MTQYTCRKISEIAELFELRAQQATALSDRLHKTKRDKLLAEREHRTWKAAADIIRNTTITE